MRLSDVSYCTNTRSSQVLVLDTCIFIHLVTKGEETVYQLKLHPGQSALGLLTNTTIYTISRRMNNNIEE